MVSFSLKAKSSGYKTNQSQHSERRNVNINTYIIIDLILKKVATWHDFTERAVENALSFLVESLCQSYHVFAGVRIANNLAPFQEVVFKEDFVE